MEWKKEGSAIHLNDRIKVNTVYGTSVEAILRIIFGANICSAVHTGGIECSTMTLSCAPALWIAACKNHFLNPMFFSAK
jgi:hypothetical protein